MYHLTVWAETKEGAAVISDTTYEDMPDAMIALGDLLLERPELENRCRISYKEEEDVGSHSQGG